MSDELRDLVQPFGDVEPPLDLHTRIVQRERELPGSGREAWHPPRVLIFAVAAAGVGLCSSHSCSPPTHGHPHPGRRTARPPIPLHSFAGSFLRGGRPNARDRDSPAPPAASLRVFKAKSQHPVVTVVLRNVSGRRCYDRVGVLVSRSGSVGKICRLRGTPMPRGSPATTSRVGTDYSRCPPFTVATARGPSPPLAVVGGRIVRRHHLSLSDITCSPPCHRWPFDKISGPRSALCERRRVGWSAKRPRPTPPAVAATPVYPLVNDMAAWSSRELADSKLMEPSRAG